MQVISNTLSLNAIFIITGTVMAVALAIMLKELRSRWFVKITQSVMLFPNYLSWIVASYILISLLSTKVNQKLYTRDETAIDSIIATFIFDPTPVQTQYADVTTQRAALIPPINSGLVDFDESIGDALDKLRAAGIDEIIEEFERQFNEFTAGSQ